MATRKELREELSKSREQAFLNLAEVAKLLGVSAKPARRFVSDLPYYEINNRKRYFVNDIAKKIDNSRVS